MFNMRAISAFLLLSGALAKQHSASGARPHDRSLQIEPKRISSYEPNTVVLDHLSIDLDVIAIEDNLNIGTDESFDNAEEIYRRGSFSKPYAVVDLFSALQGPIEEGTLCLGVSTTIPQQPVTMIATRDYAIGEKVIELWYQSANEDEGIKCQVGGNPNPNFEGCLKAEGELVVEGLGTLDYRYEIVADNRNMRFIEEFSDKAREQMLQPAEGYSYQDYIQFEEYYGSYDYANQFISAAFEKTDTNFENGRINFASFDFESRGLAISMAMVYMSILMHMIREMEDAIGHCRLCPQCIDNPVHSWDKAVAYYAGSSVGGPNSTLMYYLADIRCTSFNTCAPASDTLTGGPGWSSKVNVEVFDLFNEGQDLLQSRECDGVVLVKNRIVQLMRIPLIQGALRYAHILADDVTYIPKHRTEAATYAASVLPWIHTCSPNDAATIYGNLKADGEDVQTNFQDVKRAFERTYECLNLTCADVGGVYDVDAEVYKDGTAPCSDSGSSSGMNRSTVRIIVFTFVGIAVALIIVVFVSCCNCGGSSGTKEVELTSEIEQHHESELKLNEESVIT